MEQSLNSVAVQGVLRGQEEVPIIIQEVEAARTRVLQLLLVGGRGIYSVEDLGEEPIMLPVDRITDIKKARAQW